MRLGELISIYLKDNDLSQRQFAKKCGLSNGYISMLINNCNPKSGKPPVPSLSALLAISSGMGMTLDDMFRKVEDIDVNIGAKILPQTSNKRTVEFVELFAKLTPEQQKMLISLMKGLLGNV